MRSALLDKAIVIWIATSLVVYTCCLVVLWGWAFDSSGHSMLVTLSAMLFAISLAVRLPGRTVRVTQRVLGWVSSRSALIISLAAGGPRRSRPREVRAMMLLLAGVCVFAAAGAMLSTAAIFLAAAVADALAAAMLFSPVTWTICKLLVQFIGMFPMALGIAVAFLAAGMIRIGSGRDLYATVFREWLWALAIGLGVFGLCWQMGANLFGLAAMMVVWLLGAAAVIVQRRNVTVRPVRIQRAIETPAPARQVGIAATFGTLAVAIWLQLRLAGDAAGVGPGGSACWAAFSIAMLGGFLRRTDRKARPPGRWQLVGAMIGVGAALLVQGAMLLSAAHHGAVGAVLCLMAMGLQVPIAAMAAVIISRQRRLFAQAGGRARAYVSSGAAGAGLALLGYLAVASMTAGSWIILALVMGLCAAGLVGAIAMVKRTGNQLKWLGAGAALLLSLAAAIGGAIYGARGRIGAAWPGVWLTAVSGPQAGNPSTRMEGVLPHPPSWRGQRVDEALWSILARNKGQWLAAATSRHDLPSDVPSGVHVTVSAPDTAMVPPDAWLEPFVLTREGDFFAAGQFGRPRFDGVLLAALPADHPQAWRCYNQRTVWRSLRRLQTGGVAVLRLQSTDRGLGVALAAARAFRRVVGPCWLVFEHYGGRVDLLVAGPADRVGRSQFGSDLVVFPCRQLWYEWPGIRPLRLVHPLGALRSGPTVREFVERLPSLRR